MESLGSEEEKDMLFKKIERDILETYGSLDNPDYSFVKQALLNKPYSSVIQQLGEFVDLEEHITPDEDVSFRYFVLDKTTKEHSSELRLSMIGLYSVLLRDGPIAEILHPKTLQLT